MSSYRDRAMADRKSLRTGHVVLRFGLQRVLSRDEYEGHRDLTSYLMGDPLPGRSALDARTKQQDAR